MKSIFEKNIREAVIERIDLLHEDSDALWGKMTVTQMVRRYTVLRGGKSIKISIGLFFNTATLL